MYVGIEESLLPKIQEKIAVFRRQRVALRVMYAALEALPSHPIAVVVTPVMSTVII